MLNCILIALLFLSYGCSSNAMTLIHTFGSSTDVTELAPKKCDESLKDVIEKKEEAKKDKKCRIKAQISPQIHVPPY